MKTLLTLLLTQGLAWGASQALAEEVAQTVIEAPVIMVTTGADADQPAGQTKTVTVKAHTITATGDTMVLETDPASGDPVVLAVTGNVALATAAGADESAWMGVWLSDIPDALAAQLGLEAQGLLITKVEEDSPAARAGLQTHDIVLQLEGTPVIDDVAALGELVRAYAPGDVVKLDILRGGKPQVVTVELGQRPAAASLAKRFMFAPGAEIEEQIKTQARVLKRGPGGEWQMHEIDKLPDILHGKLGNQWMKVITEGEGSANVVKTIVEEDGSALIITRKGEGPIAVTRTDVDGNQTEEVYDTEEALQAGDAEAYDLFTHRATEVGIELKLEGLDSLMTSLKNLKDGEPLQLDIERFANIETKLGEAQAKYQDALQQISRIEDLRDSDLPLFTWYANGGEPGELGEFFTAHQVGKAATTFHRNPDDTIEVIVRKDDSELIWHFDSAADLEARKPDLYAKYAELIGEVE